MIIIKEYYKKGKKQDKMTVFTNSDITDKEFSSLTDAQKSTWTIKINLD